MKLVEERCHTGALQLSVPKNGRTAANISVLFFNSGCAPTSDDGCEKALEREGNEVTIGEEIFEKVVGLGYLLAG